MSTNTYGPHGESPDDPEFSDDVTEVTALPESTGMTEVQALKDQLLRTAADYDNFRKRAKREQDDVRRYGVERVLRDILPIMDNLDRALVVSHDSRDPVIEGVRMVVRQFHEVIGQYNVKPYTSVGLPFDPQRHEAVGQEPSTQVAPGTVLRELQQGYMIHDRLLRPARVMVAIAPESGSPNS